MIPGFNHNIKHKGRVYHIQTEDSGPKNPHIITHLFVGGNILASKKTQYSELVGQTEYEKTVRSMMEEQHKQMLRNLVNGVFDSVPTGDVHHLNGPAPVNLASTPSSAQAQPPPGTPGATRPVDFARPPGGILVTGTPLRPHNEPLPPEVVAAQKDRAEHRAVAASGTIFGEDLISEKSLDEVILSYLAEDLAELE